MAEELAVSRGTLPYTDARAVLRPFDADALRAVLTQLGLGPEDDAGVFEPGDGTVFWQVEVIRDGAGRAVCLAGDHYYDGPTPGAVRAFFDALEVLVERLDAELWIYPGPRRFVGEERDVFIAEAAGDAVADSSDPP